MGETLGFGDMYANKGSIAGHVILAVEVILGYVLLGALVSRFAVLFTAGGSAGQDKKITQPGRVEDAAKAGLLRISYLVSRISLVEGGSEGRNYKLQASNNKQISIT